MLLLQRLSFFLRFQYDALDQPGDSVQMLGVAGQAAQTLFPTGDSVGVRCTHDCEIGGVVGPEKPQGRMGVVEGYRRGATLWLDGMPVEVMREF